MGILTFGVLSEQIKTRIEQADEAKSTQVQLLIICCPLSTTQLLRRSFAVT